MKRDLREMIGNLQILNNPAPYSLVYGMLVDDTYSMFSIITLAIKFDCLFLTIYQRFHLFVGIIFDKLAPPPPPPRTYVSKDVLNHYLVHSSA